jgi:molybdenum cofactor biosynthesis protein MoaC
MIYAFEQLDDSLDLIPLAARRALDRAGCKVSLESWRAAPVATRRRLAEAGAVVAVDANLVKTTLDEAPLPYEIVGALLDPDDRAVPDSLKPTLGPAVSDATWSSLSPLDRYALAKVARKGASERLTRAISEIVIVPEPRITHLSARGEAQMVDVGAKRESLRRAVAAARVRMETATLERLRSGSIPKGDVLAAARIAGIQAAKRTPELIPLCHVVRLTSVTVDIRISLDGVRIEASAEAFDRTGVEMEALVAASTAALTVYDMCKAIDRGMTIEVNLVEKTGGTSGTWTRGAAANDKL